MVKLFNTHLKWICNLVEKITMRLIILGMMLVIVSQMALVNDEARRYLNFASYLEGTDFEILEFSESQNQAVFQGNDSYAEHYAVVNPGEGRRKGTLMIRLLDYPALNYAKILVNGEVVAAFDQNPRMIQVHDQDLVEIDISEYDFPINVEIVETSPGIRLPKEGNILEGKGSKIVLDKIVYAENKPER